MSSYNFSRVINPNPGWYCGDFHVHTNVSIDGDYPPSLVAEIAKAEGLDFIAITDHNTIEAYKEIKEDLDFLVIPGLEVTLDKGHFNVFGIRGWCDWMEDICGNKPTISLPDKYRSSNELTSQIARDGLLNSINHPLLHPWAWLYGDTDLSDIHCVELWNDLYWPDHVHANPKTVNMWTNWLNAGHRITAIGGSDYHYPPRPEEGKFGERLGMPTTYVYAEQLSVAGILEGLNKQKAYVTKGPRLTFQAEIGGLTYGIGDDLGVQDGEIIFTTNISHKPVSLKAHLVKNGDVIVEEQVKGKQASVQFREQIDPAVFAWYRLDICDSDGQTLAITNPIFSGARFQPKRNTYTDFIPP